MRIDLLITNKRYNLEYWFGLNIRINENVMCASLGDPRLRDCKLKHQNT